MSCNCPSINFCPTLMPGIDAWTVELPAPDIRDYIIGFNWPIGGKVAVLAVRSALGGGRCTVKINDTGVVGLINLILDTTRREYTASALNIVNPGDDVVFSIDSGSGSLINVSATLSFQRTQL